LHCIVDANYPSLRIFASLPARIHCYRQIRVHVSYKNLKQKIVESPVYDIFPAFATTHSKMCITIIS